jgi:SNF2 family DNA or RNA helicase
MGQIRDGQTLLTLPPKYESTIEIDWLPAEQKVYSAMKQRAKIGFLTLKRAGTLMRSILKCQALIHPLRMACSGGQSMVKGGAEVAAAAAASASGSASSLPQAMNAFDNEAIYPTVRPHQVLAAVGACMICCESIERPTQTRCAHWFCHACISTLVESASTGNGNGTAQCPMCSNAVKNRASITRHRTPTAAEVEVATGKAMPAEGNGINVDKAKKAAAAKKKKEKQSKDRKKSKQKNKKAKKKKKNSLSFGADISASLMKTFGMGAADDSESSESESDAEEVIAPIEVPVLTTEEIQQLKNGSSISLQSKLQVLLRELRSLHATDNGTDPPAKALIFSNFSSTIEWLKEKLEEEGLQFRTLDGAMSMKQRHKALADFQNVSWLGSPLLHKRLHASCCIHLKRSRC